MVQWEEKRLAALIDAAEHAIQRARYVFIAINIAGIFMLVAQFNGVLRGSVILRSDWLSSSNRNCQTRSIRR
jgi:hypothetical protein